MATKFDDQLAKFIQRGRRRIKNDNGYKPVKRSTLPKTYRPVKQRSKGY